MYQTNIPVSQFDALGTNASKLFVDSWNEQQAIKVLDETWEFLLPPYEVTINEDGTVII